MRSLLCFFILLFSTGSFSQILSRDAVIEYQIYNNTDIPNTMNATLYVNGNTTIYLPKYSTKVRGEAKGAFAEGETYSSKITFDPYYLKYNHDKKQVLFFDNIGGKNLFLIQDTYNHLHWNITNETKKIAGYECIKAVTNFRGREWTAWFTPEIPLPYGPWKLHGLPGLIIETYNEDKMYTIRVQKIEYQKDAVFDKKFETLVDTKNQDPISVRQYIEDKAEYYENLDNDMRSRGVIVGKAAPRGGYELIYEWEE